MHWGSALKWEIKKKKLKNSEKGRKTEKNGKVMQ